MKKKAASKSAFFNPRLLLGLAFGSIGFFLALLASALYLNGNLFAQQEQVTSPGSAQAGSQSENSGLPDISPAGARKHTSWGGNSDSTYPRASVEDVAQGRVAPLPMVMAATRSSFLANCSNALPGPRTRR